MGVNEIITIISTLGFPTVMTIALFWKVNNQDEKHREQIENLQKVINDNTLVITKLYERMGGVNE